jgi:hypothetical protein
MDHRMSDNDHPTRLSLRDMRSDALHRLLLSPRGHVATVDEIPRLSDLFSWPSVQVDVAIGDLVHDGRLAEDESGQLVVRRKAA